MTKKLPTITGSNIQGEAPVSPYIVRAEEPTLQPNNS